MTPRPLCCALLCALASVATLLGAVPDAQAQPADGGRGSRVTIQHMQPTSLRPGRPIEVSGVVRNTTDERWGKVQVSMLVSESPVTTESSLAEARADRGSLALRQVLAPGDFQALGDLAPGAESSFTLRNPWEQLPITRASGVYVIGVEVRAFLEDGLRSEVAETTTFIPLIGPEADAQPVDLAMLWPLTVGVARAASGYAAPTLSRQFGGNGRLTDLTELGARAGDFPLTWVVDPAVLDAADDMSDGFDVAGGESVPAEDPRATAAALWLEKTRSALSGADVLTLPYGDPDVASLAHGDREGALTQAAAVATSTLERLELPEQSLLWPAKGWADRDALRAGNRLEPVLTLLAADSVRGTRTPTVVPMGGDAGDGAGTDTTPGVVYPRRAVSPRGGETTLQWRQQLLAVTAVQALNGGGSLVVVPPRTLSPSPDWAAAEFFAGLRGGWLHPRPLSALTADPAAERPELRYPDAARRSELPPPVLGAIGALVQARDTLVGVLADPETSQRALGEAIGIAASVHWRDEPEVAESLARSHVDSILDRLAEIVVEAPSFITLSGDEGPFPVTVSNGLEDQAITVSVQVEASNDALTVQPIEQVTIEPQQRRSIPVQVNYAGVGISTVTVRMLDRNGAPFGDPVVVRVRATQIGAVIWVIMAAGGILIIGAAARRVVRRIRRRGTGTTG